MPDNHLGHTEHQQFVLQKIQPALIGLMDGSVSTLAPIFAAAFATRNTHTTFLIGLAASAGAGISMAFAEGLSDDGKLTGRGKPAQRGLIVGGMTFVGGIMHTLPFLQTSFRSALILAYIIVALELFSISYIRYHFFKMSFWISIVQVVFGGALVFAAGILIGAS